MSLYSALYAGVSGLSAQSSAMATVADNITNINTVGYKGTEADFRTLVTDGRLKASYSAGGVAMTPRATISKQGLLQAASSPTDLGIEGKGFFVTRSGPDAGSAVAYTRGVVPARRRGLSSQHRRSVFAGLAARCRGQICQ